MLVVKYGLRLVVAKDQFKVFIPTCRNAWIQRWFMSRKDDTKNLLPGIEAGVFYSNSIH
jgi:hypothetical protein